MRTTRLLTQCSLRIGALAMSASMAASCERASSVPAAPVAAADAPLAVDVVRVVAEPLNVQLSLPGELASYQMVAIFPRVSGFVKTVAVDRGSRIRSGDLLLTLDAPEIVAQRLEAQSKVQAAEAQLAAARSKAEADTSTFERLKAASAVPGVVAGNDVVVAGKAADASGSLVRSAEQGVEAARQALNGVRDMEAYLRVSAPFDGVVTERNVHPGALVGPPPAGSAVAPLLRIVDNRRLRLVVPVPEAYSSDLQGGAEIPFSVAAHPGETFTGKVARIAHTVDVGTRTMAVELDVANADGRLSAGTFTQVRWPIRRSRPSLFVPSTSVASTTGRTFVVRVRGGRAEWVDVRTGFVSGPLVEVFGDLQPGDDVANRGSDELRPGTEVRPRQPKPAAD